MGSDSDDESFTLKDSSSTTTQSKATSSPPRRRKQPLANSSSNRDEIKVKPNLTSSFVEFYAENDDSNESSSSGGSSAQFRPNEYSFQFQHPEYKPKPSRPSYDNSHIFGNGFKSLHKFGSQPDDLGYFKPIAGQTTHIPLYNEHHSFNRDKFKPVHTDFETDLHLAELPLESVPSSLKNYHHSSKQEPFDSSEYPSIIPKQHQFKHSHGSDFSDHHPSTAIINGDHSPFFRPAPHHVSNVASREQIDMYNDDLREQYEAQLEKQLRNSPNPADRAKYHQFLKAKQDEKVEQQHSKRYPQLPNGYRPRHRPGSFHYPQPNYRNKKPLRPFSTPGLRHFRDSQRFADRSYEFPFV